ncbi:MAG: signal peptidase I [Candidatus Hodarchaeota archaeon]
MDKKDLTTNKKEEKKPLPKKKVIIAVVMICFAFFGSFLVYFILQITLNSETPVVVVISNSMVPKINKGDLLFVRGVDPESIQNGTEENLEGDVIVFDAQGLWIGAPNEPIVHRVIDKWETGGTWYFQTKGDANHSPDPAPVPEDRVHGIVIGMIPFIGWVKIVLADSGLLIPILIIISALLIISIIWDIMKGEDQNQEVIEDSYQKGIPEDLKED